MVSWDFFRRNASTNEFSAAPERSSDEKALVRRLDIFLLSFGCLSQGRLEVDLVLDKYELTCGH